MVKICQPKYQDGLGVQNHDIKNLCLPQNKKKKNLCLPRKLLFQLVSDEGLC